MSERRLEAVVIGPGEPGFLKVALGGDRDQLVANVPVERVPSPLRSPNSQCVAVVDGRTVVRVESEGRAWLEIQNRIRVVLNEAWDPIGVANTVDDEYDGYIEAIYSLLRTSASDDTIANHLLSIEVEQMDLTGTPLKTLLTVAARLRELQLPVLGGPSSAA